VDNEFFNLDTTAINALDLVFLTLNHITDNRTLQRNSYPETFIFKFCVMSI